MIFRVIKGVRTILTSWVTIDSPDLRASCIPHILLIPPRCHKPVAQFLIQTNRPAARMIVNMRNHLSNPPTSIQQDKSLDEALCEAARRRHALNPHAGVEVNVKSQRGC